MTFTIFIPNNATAQHQLLQTAVQSTPSNGNIQVVSTGWNVTINNVYIQNQPVPDVLRFTLTIPPPTNANGTFLPLVPNTTGTRIGGNHNKYYDLNASHSTNQKILLVLESPHNKEYQNGNPIAPAQGSTGTRIKNWLLSIIHAHGNLGLANGNYDLIICNPVQFQASLYRIHGTPLKSSVAKGLRDKAWHAIYLHEKHNFFARLTTYSPDVIINACTSELKSFVTDELCRWKNSSPGMSTHIYYADTHASAWTARTVLYAH